jgi:hypothetical protein
MLKKEISDLYHINILIISQWMQYNCGYKWTGREYILDMIDMIFFFFSFFSLREFPEFGNKFPKNSNFQANSNSYCCNQTFIFIADYALLRPKKSLIKKLFWKFSIQKYSATTSLCERKVIRSIYKLKELELKDINPLLYSRLTGLWKHTCVF